MSDQEIKSRKPVKPGIQPGEIRNPGGRPKGSKNKLTEMKISLETAMVERLETDVTAILNKAVVLAKKGDKAMIKFILERFLPKAGTREETEHRGIGGINIVVQGIEPRIEREIKPIEAEKSV